MREILFKAKRVDNGEWVYGFYMDRKGPEIIEDGTWLIWEVDKDTICQYTGLTDKDGNKIWENDVVSFKHEKFDFDDGLEPWEITCLLNKKEYKRNYVVEFCNTPTHYGLRFRNKSIWFMIHRMTVVMHDVEVIGNTFDNADFLKGE